MTRAAAASGLLSLALSACLFGPSRDLRPVSETEVLEFAARVDSFYRALEERSVETLATFDDEKLRGYFEGGAEFSDYYASLTSQLRGADFLHARPREIHVREFWFDGPDLALVEIEMVGDHQRTLRFWKIRTTRVDTWRRAGTTWVITPEQL